MTENGRSKQLTNTAAEIGRRLARDTLGDDRVANARPETCLADKVGNGRTNRQADVRWVKDALRHLGRYADGPEQHGYIHGVVAAAPLFRSKVQPASASCC